MSSDVKVELVLGGTKTNENSEYCTGTPLATTMRPLLYRPGLLPRRRRLKWANVYEISEPYHYLRARRGGLIFCPRPPTDAYDIEGFSGLSPRQGSRTHEEGPQAWAAWTSSTHGQASLRRAATDPFGHRRRRRSWFRGLTITGTRVPANSELSTRLATGYERTPRQITSLSIDLLTGSGQGHLGNVEIKTPEDMAWPEDPQCGSAPLYMMFPRKPVGANTDADRVRRSLPWPAAGHCVDAPGKSAATFQAKEVLRGYKKHSQR